jgi:biopolymer transport protein TolR
MPRKIRVPRAIPAEGSGELNVVPFLDILLNVLMFVLATIAVTWTTRLEVSPPRRDVRGPHPDTLGLNVAVLHDGFVVSARGQRLGQAASRLAPGLPSAPRRMGTATTTVSRSVCGGSRPRRLPASAMWS